MSLVERLAEKRGPWIHQNRDEARWWLNAIADEIQEVEADKSGPFRNMNAVSDWLRSQANPDSAESD